VINARLLKLILCFFKCLLIRLNRLIIPLLLILRIPEVKVTVEIIGSLFRSLLKVCLGVGILLLPVEVHPAIYNTAEALRISFRRNKDNNHNGQKACNFF
jgi:hypothetical protein